MSTAAPIASLPLPNSSQPPSPPPNPMSQPSPQYILLSFFILILSALSYLPIYKQNILHGKSRPIAVEKLHSDKCTIISQTHNCFDIAVDRSENTAYLSCDPSNFAHLHTLNRASLLPQNEPDGAVYKYSSGSPVEKLEIRGIPHAFHPLGLFIHNGLLLIINYPNSTVFVVDVFQIQNNNILLWKQSISDPLFNYPNKIAVVSDQPGTFLPSFYISNTYGLTGLWKSLENRLFGRRGSVLFYNARIDAASQVIWGLDFPSAVQVLDAGERLLISTMSAEISEFRQHFTKDLMHVERVNNIEIYNPLFIAHSFKTLDIPIDHIAISNSSIYAIGSSAYHLRTLSLQSSTLHHKKKVVPTTIYKLDAYYDILLQNGSFIRTNDSNHAFIKAGGVMAKYSVQKILQDDGEIVDNGKVVEFLSDGMVIAGDSVVFCSLL
ncbi:hypothetical protein NEOLI_003300 [Neolecta irregularis DAH-3]|uniref:Serum paraoxonase/lactonase 3 n=1 Tax=Neolecta irregularis (strain DAH-3) TaxID=1198029 RepID=A0A1U7LRT6_NEOID|nr:hypothetical protein NEOLI_003300 [Neolecta irregularis DAH-3]|eukprot:OLL25339.1 hypothetical protein NEOLI_003300 [Neolecta irregularis DAH-3]